MSSATATRAKLLARSKRFAIVAGLGLFGFAISGFVSSMLSGRALAQEGLPGSKGGKGQPGAKGQPGKGPGGFGAFTNGFDAVKTQIKATDEEWKVIGPKLREVMAARQAANTGMIGEGSRGGFGPGGFGPPGGGGFGPPGGGGFGPPGGPGGFGPPGGGPGGFGPPGGGAGGPGPGGGDAPPSFLDFLKLTAEQKKDVEALQKEFDSKLEKILTEDQNKSFKEMRAGRGGFGVPPLAGPILFPIHTQKLNLTADQKPKVEEIQKEIDGKLEKLLDKEQNKQLTAMRDSLRRLSPGQQPGFGAGGPAPFGGGGPGIGGGPPGFGGGTAGGDSAISQALNELQSALDDTKTTPAQRDEKVAAVRAARKKAREKLASAQKELLLLITSDQEAVLIRLGYLD